MGIHSLGYLRLTSPDPEAWRRFGTDVLGMDAVDLGSGIGLRIDEDPYRLAVVAGERRAVEAIGFQVAGAHALEGVIDKVAASGTEVHIADPVDAAARGVSALVRFPDPFGAPIEVFHGPKLVHDPPARGHVSGFLTGDLGMGHVVLGGPEAHEALAFYLDVLGFEVRNTMQRAGSTAEHPDDRIWFLGCNSRHHTVALFERPGPWELVHFMVEVLTIDDVGRSLDRALAAGFPQRLTLGRHSNDGMVSFYTSTPDDYTIEVGHDGRIVAPGAPSYEITRGSYWGHARVER